MISRLRRTPALAAVIVGSALLTAACEKVPLLAPSGSTITLTAAATALPSNGSTDIIAQVIEASGTPPHSGTLITFTTNLGTVRPSEAETDLSGRVIVKYIAGGGSGTATITAISGGVSASGASAIKIAVGAAAVGGIALSASPSTLPASGGTTTIAAVVNDSGGNPLPGVPVTFSTDNGSLSTSVVNTDANGRAATTLTTSRTAKVTAGAGVTTTTTTGTPPATTTTAASTNTITVTVNASATVAFGTFSPATPVAGQPVSFTLTVTPSTTGGAIQSVVVNFGDGRSQSLGAVSGATALSHTYDSPGSYTLSATATDSNGDAFPAVAAITVGNRPPANVTIVASPVAPQVGQQVAFTITTTFPSANTALVQSVSIDFGDGSSAQPGAQTTAIAQHVYQTVGTYAATAVVRDTNGGSTSSQTQVIVGPRSQLVVTISSATASPAAGTSITFAITATPTTGNAITSLAVDFGDGSKQTFPGNTTSVQHVYTTSGTYVVTATATDSSSASGSASMVLLVGQLARPTVSVTIVTGQTLQAGQATNFTVTAAAASSAPVGTSVRNVSVDFGDSTTAVSLGAASSTTTVPHVYASFGTYTVTATATDTNGGTNSASTIVIIGLASFTISPTAGSTSTTFQFNASDSTASAGIASYAWDFGDGFIGTGVTSSRKYAASGVFTVRLTVTDISGRTATTTKTVTVS